MEISKVLMLEKDQISLPEFLDGEDQKFESDGEKSTTPNGIVKFVSLMDKQTIPSSNPLISSVTTALSLDRFIYLI